MLQAMKGSGQCRYGATQGCLPESRAHPHTNQLRFADRHLPETWRLSARRMTYSAVNSSEQVTGQFRWLDLR
jgi:hypothetical protein